MNIVASLIIPTCNRTDLLANCLQALVPQLPGDGSVELLVCDDGRDRQTRDFLARCHPGIQWHEGPRKGPGPNRNVGAGRARGDWLIFIDDDCVPRPGYLAAYLAAFRELGAGTRSFLPGQTFREADLSLLKEAAYYHGEDPLPPSCNFAIPRALFLEIGGFDPRYRHSFEDIELFSRLGVSGVSLRYLAEAAADHPSRPIARIETLAARWEARVTSSYDFGAAPGEALWRVPKHVLLVILSRFRGRRWNRENLRAAWLFAGEFIIFLARFPRWLVETYSQPRSAFWEAQRKLGKTPPKFGL